jgi:hypothetical protein
MAQKGHEIHGLEWRNSCKNWGEMCPSDTVGKAA